MLADIKCNPNVFTIYNKISLRLIPIFQHVWIREKLPDYTRVCHNIPTSTVPLWSLCFWRNWEGSLCTCSWSSWLPPIKIISSILSVTYVLGTLKSDSCEKWASWRRLLPLFYTTTSRLLLMLLSTRMTLSLCLISNTKRRGALQWLAQQITESPGNFICLFKV